MSLSPEEQRARLSKAMGAAFLAHQVSKLERSVDSMSFSRDPRLQRGGRGRGGASSSSGGGGRAGKRETRVVDPSALVHALPLLKRWIREGSYLLIIPLEALSILDQLKRSPPPLHDLARDATRFLETQLGPGGSGIVRAQKAGEELRWTECEKRFALPEDWVTEPLPPREVPLEEGEEEEEEVLPMPGDVPRTLRSVLQCALHFHEAQGTPLVVFHASSQPFLPPTPTTTRPGDLRAPPPETDFLSLSSGTPLASYAPFFALPLQSITTSEVGEAREWAKAVQSAKSLLARSLDSGLCALGDHLPPTDVPRRFPLRYGDHFAAKIDSKTKAIFDIVISLEQGFIVAGEVR